MSGEGTSYILGLPRLASRESCGHKPPRWLFCQDPAGTSARAASGGVKEPAPLCVYKLTRSADDASKAVASVRTDAVCCPGRRCGERAFVRDRGVLQHGRRGSLQARQRLPRLPGRRRPGSQSEAPTIPVAGVGPRQRARSCGVRRRCPSPLAVGAPQPPSRRAPDRRHIRRTAETREREVHHQRRALAGMGPSAAVT